MAAGQAVNPRAGVRRGRIADRSRARQRPGQKAQSRPVRALRCRRMWCRPKSFHLKSSHRTWCRQRLSRQMTIPPKTCHLSSSMSCRQTWKNCRHSRDGRTRGHGRGRAASTSRPNCCHMSRRRERLRPLPVPPPILPTPEPAYQTFPLFTQRHKTAPAIIPIACDAANSLPKCGSAPDAGPFEG